VAVDVLGDEVARAVLGVAAVDDVGDVLVAETAEDVGLAPEAVDWVARQVIAEDLDDDALAERGVLRLVHRRHAARTDPAAHEVALAEGRRDRRDRSDPLPDRHEALDPVVT
jgi:hypothetical protein